MPAIVIRASDMQLARSLCPYYSCHSKEVKATSLHPAGWLERSRFDLLAMIEEELIIGDTKPAKKKCL